MYTDGELTDLHSREDDVVPHGLLVAADVVYGLALDEIEAAEDGAAGNEEAPKLLWRRLVGLGRPLSGLSLLGRLEVVGEHSVVFGLHEGLHGGQR